MIKSHAFLLDQDEQMSELIRPPADTNRFITFFGSSGFQTQGSFLLYYISIFSFIKKYVKLNVFVLRGRVRLDLPILKNIPRTL